MAGLLDSSAPGKALHAKGAAQERRTPSCRMHFSISMSDAPPLREIMMRSVVIGC